MHMPETELKTHRPRGGEGCLVPLPESLRVNTHLVLGMHVYNFNDRPAAGALHVEILRLVALEARPRALESNAHLRGVLGDWRSSR